MRSKPKVWIAISGILVLILSFWLIQSLMNHEDPTDDWVAVNDEVDAAIMKTNENQMTTIDEKHTDADKDLDKDSMKNLDKNSDQNSVESVQPLLININQASAAELDKLPGIGAVKAKAIVDYRVKIGNYQTKEDIMKVKGIGAKTFENLKDNITLQ